MPWVVTIGTCLLKGTREYKSMFMSNAYSCITRHRRWSYTYIQYWYKSIHESLKRSWEKITLYLTWSIKEPTHQSRYFLWSAFFSTFYQSYEWLLTTEPHLRFIMKFAKCCCQVLLPMASVSYHISDRGKMRPICKVLIIFPYMQAQGQICIAVDTYCHSTVFSAILGGYF